MLAIIKQIKLKKSLIPFLVIALLIRAYLLFLPAFKIDIDAWIAWSLRLHDVGFTNFYSPTYFSDYLPGYLYILYLIGFVQKVFSLPLDDFANCPILYDQLNSFIKHENTANGVE